MSALQNWQSLSDYQASRCDKFPSLESLNWQLREHRADLIRAGALAKLCGRLYVNGESADRVFIEAGQRRLAKLG